MRLPSLRIPAEAGAAPARRAATPLVLATMALVLHHLCDMPLAEVAVAVGAPIGTVKARLSRGRASLQSLLAEEGTSHV